MKERIAPAAVAGLVAGVAFSSIQYGVAAWPFSEGEEPPTLAPLLAEVTPAVVNVAVVGGAGIETNPLLQDPNLRRFFGIPDEPEGQPQPREQNIGSGVIVDAAEGLIVTNHHVIRDADSIVVTLSNRRQFDATLVGSDELTDIALLKIESGDHRLSAISFGDSDELEVGDYVVAIGNPFGLGQTATSGIVSALGRGGVNIEGYEDFIQTDASINPGNSGGALVSLRGDLVGINSAIISAAGGNIGIGFAIPSNMTREVIGQLREYGEVRRGQLGVFIQDVSPGLATALDLEVDQGALVTQVTPGSPAESAGIAVGDVLVAVDDEPVESSSELRNVIGLVRLGDSVALSVVRGSEMLTIEASIGAPVAEAAPGAPPARESSQLAVLEGVQLANLPSDHPLASEMEGVLVTGVREDSAAWRQGLRPNDVITAVNRIEVASVQELAAAAEQSGMPLALLVRRENRQLFILLE